tara:strand:+ start:460 stop:663 length:204 start_codon:yes stop_codon:yes gene_type:complete
LVFVEARCEENTFFSYLHVISIELTKNQELHKSMRSHYDSNRFFLFDFGLFYKISISLEDVYKIDAL